MGFIIGLIIGVFFTTVIFFCLAVGGRNDWRNKSAI